ncbi:MAG TPA: hypothetical protein VE865_06595 [Bradyrhizobium sp.]|nr:hypothetical protein [Bradyrhizobium sp.]
MESAGVTQSDFAALVAVPRVDALDAAIDIPRRALIEWEARRLVSQLGPEPPKTTSKPTAVEVELARLARERDQKLARAETEIQRLLAEIGDRDARLAEVDKDLRNIGTAMRAAQVRLIEADGEKHRTSEEAADAQRRLVAEIQNRDQSIGKLHEHVAELHRQFGQEIEAREHKFNDASRQTQALLDRIKELEQAIAAADERERFGGQRVTKLDQELESARAAQKESDERATTLERHLKEALADLNAIQSSRTWRALSGIRTIVPERLRRTKV